MSRVDGRYLWQWKLHRWAYSNRVYFALVNRCWRCLILGTFHP